MGNARARARWLTRLTVFALGVGMLLAAGCGGAKQGGGPGAQQGAGQAGQPAGKGPQILLIANDQEPVGLDPAKNPAASSLRIMEKLYNGLTRLNENMEVVPDLAEKWEVPDPTTYVFTLRQGVKFHNGRELTSADVKYTFERILDPQTASIAKSYFEQVASIETPDPRTVRFKLKEPFAPFLTNTASTWASIVPRETVEKNGDLNKVADGTGPFKLAEWLPDNHVKLVRNPDYFVKGEPKVDGITFLTMKDEAARLAAIRTGKVHLTTVSADSARLLAGEPDVRVIDYQSLQYSYLGMNAARKPFDDPRVRKAISLAVNRQEIIDTVWKGKAVLTGPTPPALKDWAIPVDGLPGYKPDVAAARKLLADAGLAQGFKTTLKTASTYPDMVETAQVVQAQLKAIGVQAEIVQLEWGQYVDAWKKKDMDLMVGRNTAGTDPDRSLAFFFHSKGSANVWNFADAEFDKLVEDGRRAKGQNERKQLYSQAQARLIELAPNLFLASPRNFVALRKNVEGFVPMPNGQELNLARTSLRD